MKIRYRKNKLERSVKDAKALKKNYGKRAKKVKTRLDEIAAAPNLLDLMNIPGPNCHQLTGDREYQFAVDISGNERIILEVDHDSIPKKEDGGIDCQKVTAILIISIGEDYH